ncbi:MAG: substrate-binding domain-containing protein, partial [Phycisphaerae bacterium]|nr:substrate-binding domain-containing protein [Phycisphaerae bacterium]
AAVVRIPLEQNEISHVAIGVLSSATNKPAAHRFVDFITSERGRAIFAEHHYRTEPPGQRTAEP